MYGEAIAAVVVATLLTWAMRKTLASTPLILYWVMSVAIARRGGLRPTLLAAVLAVVASNVVMAHPLGSLAAPSVPELIRATIYLTGSVLLGITFESLHRARAAAERSAIQLNQAGLELERNAQQLAQAVDGMSDSLFVFDPEWRLSIVNSAARSLLRRMGRDPGAILGQVLWDEFPHLIGSPLQDELLRVQRERLVFERELSYKPAALWLSVRTVPTPEGGIASFVQDTTTAHDAELARRRSEERYRALVEATTVMVWTADPDGAVRDMPLWREITGQSPEEVRGRGWIDAVHPDDRERVREDWSTALRRKETCEVEYRLRLHDGHYRWFRSRAVPIWEGARIVEWVGVFDDVHETRVAADLRRTVENVLTVLGTSLDYEWTLAALTRLIVPTLADYCSVDLLDADGTIRRVSSAHVDPAKEVVLREMWQRYPYQSGDRAGVPEVLRSGQPQVSLSLDPAMIVAFARTPEHAAMLATLGPRSYACVPMSARGHVFGALSLVYSDSGRQYTEAEINTAQEIAVRAAAAIENARLYAAAQAANRAKSDFLATMSHELRTPLNAIAGYAELLAMGVRGPVNEEQIRDLSRIRQNQQHLLEIITDILSFSRIEAGRVKYAISPVPVNDVLVRVEGAIEPQARARDIDYRCELATADLTALADRERLDQILINLLGNAVKFTAPGGRISLRAEPSGDRVRIHVADTGIGIAPAQLALIFEPFVQLEPALTRTTDGAGLGLAISRELARGMNGELSAVSTPGAGSVFTLDLPRAHAVT